MGLNIYEYALKYRWYYDAVEKEAEECLYVEQTREAR